MYQTLAQMRKDLMGMVPGFPPATYDSAINRAYDDLAKSYPWQELETEVNLATKKFIDTGGAHFTNGSTDVTAATTVSAAWTSGESNGFAGMFIVKRDEASYYTITASDSVSVTLTSNYLGNTTTAVASAGDGYAIFKHLYELDSTVEDVISVNCEDNRLKTASELHINRHDADFQDEGEPIGWRSIGRNSAGNTVLQIYPALSDDIYVLRVVARKKVETLTDTTKPLLDSTLINAFAEVELINRKKLMDPNAVQDSMIEAKMANAANHFNYATERDRRIQTEEPYVRDGMFRRTNRGQNWWVTHDPWDA
jgi:hypothetical protein